MKRILLFLSVLFIATAAIAEEITINWGADNKNYTTTSCEIGNDVILPTPPTKRGHIFKGWIAEHFYRGIFANFNIVPSATTEYEKDYLGNKTPKENDYIIVKDSSQYATEFSLKRKGVPGRYRADLYDETGTQLIQSAEVSNLPVYWDDGIKIAGSGVETLGFFAVNQIKYEGKIYNSGEKFFSFNYYHPSSAIYFFVPTAYLTGTWKFVYQGNWEIDGKNGWKPVEQIISQ